MTAILGGGIGGLSAAYYALKNKKLGSIVLYEGSSRVGGWIQSLQAPSGVMFEKGPRTIRPGGPGGMNTLKLIHELNLSDHIVSIKSTHPAACNRLIYVNKKLHSLPNSLKSLFKIQSPFKQPLIYALWKDVTTPKVVKEDDSIYSFVERRFGKEFADYLISPMICGICAGNPKEISVNFLFKNEFEYEQNHGSISRGFALHILKNIFSKKQEVEKENMDKIDLIQRAIKERWSIWSLQGGLEKLPLTLQNNLSSNNNIKINTQTPCEQITFKSGEVELLVNGKIENYDRVISSLSAKNLAPLVQRQHPQLSRELGAIPCATVAVVNLHYHGKVLPMEAFGFLVPPDETLPILGVIFDSCVFDNAVHGTVLTVMMGGAFFNKYFGDNVSEENLLSVAVNQTKSILNIKEDPIEHHVAVLKDCIPQYVVGHNQRLHRIQNYISSHKLPLTLCGSSYHGVGLNDVILSAKQAVSHTV